MGISRYYPSLNPSIYVLISIHYLKLSYNYMILLNKNNCLQNLNLLININK